jgi:RNA polymerase sigma-70 factor (ECF subfamily)
VPDGCTAEPPRRLECACPHHGARPEIDGGGRQRADSLTAGLPRPQQPPPPSASSARTVCERSYELLFTKHYTPIFAVCRRYLNDDGDAEDVTQETFVRALDHPEVFNKPRAWLICVATRLCIDHLRRRRRVEMALSSILVRTAHATPEFAADGELAGSVDDALAMLTLAERRVLTCTLLEDLSHAETGRRLGIAESTSRVLLSRALKRLRAQPTLGDHAILQGRPIGGSDDEQQPTLRGTVTAR